MFTAMKYETIDGLRLQTRTAEDEFLPAGSLFVQNTIRKLLTAGTRTSSPSESRDHGEHVGVVRGCWVLLQASRRRPLCPLRRAQGCREHKASVARMAPVFVYGTLKRGQPNHKVLLDGTNGCAAFQGRGRTVEPYPLVIAGEHNIPRLLNLPGQGQCVVGEIYAVDEQMLRFLDEFEGCPDMYQRMLVRIAVLEWEDTQGAPEETLASDGTLQCFVYSTGTYSPEWVHLPSHDNYDSHGKHGLRYNPRENR